MINVASFTNGVGYGAWTHIDGWSEAVIEYIRSLEVRPTLVECCAGRMFLPGSTPTQPRAPAAMLGLA